MIIIRELISLNGNTEQNCEISCSSKHKKVSRPLCLIDKSCDSHYLSSSSSTLSHFKNSSALVASLQQWDKKYILVPWFTAACACVCVCSFSCSGFSSGPGPLSGSCRDVTDEFTSQSGSDSSLGFQVTPAYSGWSWTWRAGLPPDSRVIVPEKVDQDPGSRGVRLRLCSGCIGWRSLNDSCCLWCSASANPEFFPLPVCYLISWEYSRFFFISFKIDKNNLLRFRSS